MLMVRHGRENERTPLQGMYGERILGRYGRRWLDWGTMKAREQAERE